MVKAHKPKLALGQNKLQSNTNKAELYAKQVAAEAMLEYLPVTFCWLDKEGYGLGCNNKLLRDLRLVDVKQFIGKHSLEIAAAEAWKNSKEVINKKISAIYEETHIHKDGSKIYYLSIKSPLLNEKKEVVGLVCMAIDISDLKNTQQALIEAYESKAQLLSTAAHEIRGPMGNVYTMQRIQMEEISKLKTFFYDEVLDAVPLEKRKLLIEKFQERTEKIDEFGDIVKQEVVRSLGALSNLVALNVLQREGVKVNNINIKISGLIEEAIKDSKYPNDREIEFHQKIDKTLPEKVVIDYENIYEALRVIIGNAIRFSKPRSIVKISVEKAVPQWLNIIIEDFGKGLSASQIQHIFQPSFDVNVVPEERRYQKPSLQLPQVKLRIEASGGKIDMQSAPNCGTKVILSIPYTDSAESFNHPVEQEAPVPPQYYLLVEDDPLMQKNTRALMEQEGHRVDVAATAEEALNFVLKHTYDAVFLDITLPDKNGVYVLREIVKNKKNYPVIILTSHDTDTDESYFLMQGATHIIPKPVSPEMLKDCFRVLYWIRQAGED